MDALTPPFAPLLQRGAADGMEAGLFRQWSKGCRVRRSVPRGTYAGFCDSGARVPSSAECTLLRHRPGGGSTARRTNHMQC